ncbi:hypothetical protein ACF0H5_020324 [Mactra antiquata]
MYNIMLYRCLLMYVVTTCMFNYGAGRMCPRQNHTESPRFTLDLNAAEYVRYGHFIGLLCCAEGYDQIYWFKKTKISGWQLFPPDSGPSEMAPEVKDHGQVLKFYSVELPDEALYRCDVMKNNIVTLTHMVKLNVEECDKPAQGPVPTDPEPMNQTIYEYGGHVTIHCTGYYGCQDGPHSSFEIVRWSMLGSTKEITDISPRYHTNSSQSEEGAVKQSTLTISPVLEEDTERTFICTLASAQKIRGQTHTHVKIFKRDKPMEIWLIVCIIVGGVMIIIVIITCLKCLCGPQVRLFFNRILPKFGPKYITDTNIIWNTYVYHADEDEDIATQWKNQLENLGYKVRISADMKSGQSRINDFKEAITKSALVVFLYSDHLLQDEMASLFLNIVVTERNGRDIMFLEKTNFKPREIRDWAKDAKTVPVEGIEDLSTKVSIEVDADQSIDTDTDIEIAQKIDDLKFWKFIPRFKVPKDGSSKRVKKNFLCSLRNTIPRFKEVKKRNGDKKVSKERTESVKPLLGLEDPPDSPISPAGFDNGTLELSPNMSPDKHNEFDFDQTQVLKIAGKVRSTTFDEHNPHTKINIESQENGFIGNPNNQIYVEETHTSNNEIVTDIIIHDTDIKTVENNRENQNNKASVQVSDTGYNLRQQMPNEDINPKETIFTMSDEENKCSSPNTESVFMSSGEESAKGDNPNSGRSRITSPSSSSCHSSSGFGSQSPSTASPTNFSNQSFSPKDEFPGHNFSDDPYKVKDAYSEQGQAIHDENNVKVITGHLDRSSRSPEEGYMTSSADQFSSAETYLP